MDFGVTTVKAHRDKGAKDLNPLINPFIRRPFLFGGIKLGVGLSTAWIAEKIHKTHPRFAKVLSAIFIGLPGLGISITLVI